MVSIDYRAHQEQYSPSELLEPGDEVTVEVEGIGALTNPVVAQDD